jgi:transcriptional regulator of acetoin/glycerol metabolism
MSELNDVIATAESADPADGLRAASVLRKLAEQIEAKQVVAARRAGWSWQEIGDALGISRQAVHKKHRRRDV